MSDGIGRGSFFKQLLREFAQAKSEVEEAIREQIAELQEEDERTKRRARPVPRTVEPGELREHARELGLARVEDRVAALARPALRLTRAARADERTGATRLGGRPDLPAGFEWPRRGERPLAFLAQVDLAQAAALDPQLPLPSEGLLLFFWDAEEQPSGLEPEHEGAAAVVLVPPQPLQPAAEDAGPAPLRPYPVELSRELTLPGEYSSWTEPLGLTPEEDGAWATLRERVDELQGRLEDDPLRDQLSLHRLLGYADEVWGEPEKEAQLASSGLSANEIDDDPRREGLEAQAGDWRILLQLSADEELGTPWAGSWGTGGKLYLAIREDDLAAARFDRVWPILQAW